MSEVPFFVACHVGAGFHSISKEGQYTKVLHAACRSAAGVLKEHSDPMEAVVAAIRVLEVRQQLIQNQA